MLLEKYECVIRELYEDTFMAHLYNCAEMKEFDILEGTFKITDFPENKRHLIKPGVKFLWSIHEDTTTVEVDETPNWENFFADTSKKESP